MGYLLLIFMLGVLTPIQTVANSRLRESVVSPLVGISGGAVFAMQPPMNSLLSAGLSSAIHAAFVSFLSATVVLLVVVLLLRDSRRHIPQIFSLQRSWWSWLGGIIGGTFVMGFAFFAAKVGVGLLLVTSICGLLTCSLLIDKYGLLGTAKKPVGGVQYIGLLCVVAGIAVLPSNVMSSL